MKDSPLLLTVLVLLAVAAYLALSNRKSTKASIDSEQELFDNVMAWHNVVGKPLDESPDLFLATYFTKNHGLIARSCGLYRTGHMALIEESQDGVEFLPSPGGQFTPALVAQISNLIQTLPPDQKPEQWQKLLIFTFLDSKRKRQTRLYNRASLPPEVREIYRITNALLEEADL